MTTTPTKRPGDVIADMTSAGGPYPLTRRVVNGRDVVVFDSPVTTLQHVLSSMSKHGDRPALVYGTERWSYTHMITEAGEVATGLHNKFGIGHADSIAIAMRNLPEWPIVFWAAQMLGATVVPLNAWSTADELAYLLNVSAPTAVFVDPERLSVLPSPRPSSVRGVVGVRCEKVNGVVSYSDLRVDGHTLDVTPVDDQDAATLMFTSGTTGTPKAAVATHLNYVTTLHSMGLRSAAARVAAGGPAFPETPPAPLLLGFPLFHIAGITAMTAAHAAGRCIVTMRKWDIEQATELIVREGVGEIGGPPLIGRSVLDAAAEDPTPFASLTSIGFGGALVPPNYIDDVRTIFEGRVAPKTGYGMTETTSAVVSIAGEDFFARPTSVGRPLPTAEIAVVDDLGEPVPAGTRGELIVRGSQVITGYHGRPDKTEESFRDGWFRTGDLVRIDDGGFVHIIGRAKDVVIRGGENVYCAEVEGVLSGHPDVVEVAVIGVPHERLGEEVCAVVHMRPNADPSPDELIAFAHRTLASFKVPAYIVYSAAPLPRNGAEKLVKSALVDRLPADLTESTVTQWI